MLGKHRKKAKPAASVPEQSAVLIGDGGSPRRRLRLPRLKPQVLLMLFIVALIGILSYLLATRFNRDEPTQQPIARKLGVQSEIERTDSIPESPDATDDEKAAAAHTKGVLYMSDGQYEQAIPELLKAEKLYKAANQKYSVWSDLGDAYAKTSDKDKARGYYQKILDYLRKPTEGMEVNPESITYFENKIKELD